MQATDCTNSGNIVIHATDQNTYCVDAVSWSSYMSGMTVDEFNGVYRPRTSMSSTKKNDVIDTAQDLAASGVTYVLWAQIDYTADCYTLSILEPENIYGIRCDGVVEYSYEYNNIIIYGSSSIPYTNISKPSENSIMYHYGTNITPKRQAQNYMTLVQSGIPSAN